MTVGEAARARSGAPPVGLEPASNPAAGSGKIQRRAFSPGGDVEGEETGGGDPSASGGAPLVLARVGLPSATVDAALAARLAPHQVDGMRCNVSLIVLRPVSHPHRRRMPRGAVARLLDG